MGLKITRFMKYMRLMSQYRKFAHQNDYPHAIETLKKVIELDFLPNYGWEELGNVYEWIGRFEEAENAYKQMSCRKLSKRYAEFLVRRERHDEAAAVIEAILNERMGQMMKGDDVSKIALRCTTFMDKITPVFFRKKKFPKDYFKSSWSEMNKKRDDWEMWAADYLMWYKDNKSQ
jgi:tetratricopeptide (TPR) repeat protein